MKIFKNLETGSVVEGLLMDVVPSGYRELKAGEVMQHKKNMFHK